MNLKADYVNKNILLVLNYYQQGILDNIKFEASMKYHNRKYDVCKAVKYYALITKL